MMTDETAEERRRQVVENLYTPTLFLKAESNEDFSKRST